MSRDRKRTKQSETEPTREWNLSLSEIKFAGRNLCNNLLSPEAEIYKIISRLLKNFPSSSSYQEVFGPGEAASRGHEIGGSHAENDFGPCEMEPLAVIWWRAPFLLAQTPGGGWVHRVQVFQTQGSSPRRHGPQLFL